MARKRAPIFRKLPKGREIGIRLGQGAMNVLPVTAGAIVSATYLQAEDLFKNMNEGKTKDFFMNQWHWIKAGLAILGATMVRNPMLRAFIWGIAVEGFIVGIRRLTIREDGTAMFQAIGTDGQLRNYIVRRTSAGSMEWLNPTTGQWMAGQPGVGQAAGVLQPGIGPGFTTAAVQSGVGNANGAMPAVTSPGIGPGYTTAAVQSGVGQMPNNMAVAQEPGVPTGVGSQYFGKSIYERYKERQHQLVAV